MPDVVVVGRAKVQTHVGDEVEVDQVIKPELSAAKLHVDAEADTVRHGEGDVHQEEDLDDVPARRELALGVADVLWQRVVGEEARRVALVDFAQVAPLRLHRDERLQARAQEIPHVAPRALRRLPALLDRPAVLGLEQQRLGVHAYLVRHLGHVLRQHGDVRVIDPVSIFPPQLELVEGHLQVVGDRIAHLVDAAALRRFVVQPLPVRLQVELAAFRVGHEVHPLPQGLVVHELGELLLPDRAAPVRVQPVERVLHHAAGLAPLGLLHAREPLAELGEAHLAVLVVVHRGECRRHLLVRHPHVQRVGEPRHLLVVEGVAAVDVQQVELLPGRHLPAVVDPLVRAFRAAGGVGARRLIQAVRRRCRAEIGALRAGGARRLAAQLPRHQHLLLLRRGRVLEAHPGRAALGHPVRGSPLRQQGAPLVPSPRSPSSPAQAALGLADCQGRSPARLPLGPAPHPRPRPPNSTAAADDPSRSGRSAEIGAVEAGSPNARFLTLPVYGAQALGALLRTS